MSRFNINKCAAAPVIGGEGTTVPADWRQRGGEAAPLQVRVSSDRESRERGYVLLERFRELVKRLRRRGVNDEKAMRDLRRLVASVPESLVLAVPEFLEYVAELIAGDQREAVRYLLGAVRRGAPMELHRYLVAMVDLVKRQEGNCISDAEACRLLHDLPNSPFRHLGVGRMRTAYSEQRDVLRATSGYFVSERDLAEVPRDLLEEIIGTVKR